MVSLELAQKLKESGLVWEPQEGDCLSILYNRGLPSEYRKLVYLNEDDVIDYAETNGEVRLPSLDQLLAEIDERGYFYTLSNVRVKSASLYKRDENGYFRLIDEFRADSLEDATAIALLWILRS